MRVIFVLFFLCLITRESYANYDICYSKAANIYGIPEVILRVLSYIESGDNPYAINIGGRGYYLTDELSAQEKLKANTNKNMDIGIMQINSWWFKRYGYERELGLDACWNIHMGAYILSYEYKRHNEDIWQAIAHYHSPKEKYQKRYVTKVYKEVQKWQRASR